MTRLIIGQPVKPMLVSESPTNEKKFAAVFRHHKGKTLSETKYDGDRIQVHKSSRIWLFTKNSHSLAPELFPDLREQLKKLPAGIYDGELVGLESGILGFNAVKRRMKEYADEEAIKQFPLQIKFFDALLRENRDLTEMPLWQRRREIEGLGNIVEQEEIDNPEKLKDKFDYVTSHGIEGLVCKNPASLYLPGKRTKDWIKLKKFLSLDLVVLGVYRGEGKAADLPFAALLLGVKNNDHYETLTKVGISSPELILPLCERLKPAYIPIPPSNILLSRKIKKRQYTRKVPFSYIIPEQSSVVEVECLNVTRSKNWHSCGLEDGEAYSLRISIVKRLRYDKEVQDCATSQQVKELYTN